MGFWWIVSDLGEFVMGCVLCMDYVFGVGGVLFIFSGLLIVGEIVGGWVESVLDLGIGCGI